MITLFNIEEPGMTIRPIHRLIHALPNYDAQAFLKRAEDEFNVKQHGSLAEMEEAVKKEKNNHSFGFYSGGIYASLTLKDEGIMDKLITGNWSPDWKRLDVSILHTLTLERLLGIDSQALEEQKHNLRP